MKTTAAIRSLMTDGRARTSREVARAVGSTVPSASRALRRTMARGLVLRFPAPPTPRRRPCYLWRLDPNCPALLAPVPASSAPSI